MKKVYRCSIKKEDKSSSFVKTPELKDILKRVRTYYTESTHPLEAIFNRAIPVDEKCMSRFVPVGYATHAVYFSDDKNVTFFEYLFHIAAHSLKKGIPLELTVFHAELNFISADIKNINKMVPKKRKKILSPTTYKHSHAFIKELKKIPQGVTYKNVRCGNGANNHAVFDRFLVHEFTAELDSVIAIITDKTTFFEVELKQGNISKIIIIKKVEIDS